METLVPSAVPAHSEAHGLVPIARKLKLIQDHAHDMLKDGRASRAIDIRNLVIDAMVDLDKVEQALVEDVKKQVAACRGCTVCPNVK